MIADLGAIYAYRHDVQKDIIKRMSGPSIVGLMLGFLLLGRLPDAEVKFWTGMALLMLSLTYYVSQLYPTQSSILFTQSPLEHEAKTSSLYSRLTKFALSTTVIGLVSGVLTVIANIAGPVIAVYLIELQLPKRQLNGTRAFLFLLANLVKIPAQIYLGNLDGSDMVVIIPLAILAVTSTFLTEAYIMPLVDQRTFERLSWSLVSFGALKLILCQ